MVHLLLGLVLLAGNLPITIANCQMDPGPNREIPMDMALNSFDDRYEGCTEMMEQELEELNRTEFASNKVYAEGWTKAVARWQKSRHCIPKVPGMRPEHVIAILAYTEECPLYKEFNKAVPKAGRSRQEYLRTFNFKVLHFLLSEALRILKDSRSGRCYSVYRGIKGHHFTAQRLQSVRFGSFASTSLRKDVAMEHGEDTLFSVYTCYGALIRDFSCFPREEEVLVPPFEKFKVTSVTNTAHGARIQLRSQKVHNTYNCEWVKG
ncbi:NARE ribosyltransferase, partial [Centropus bengalensis]|nr:NARE ribosyltransferase [Centropus bengalensis]